MFLRSIVFLTFFGLSAAFVIGQSSEDGSRSRRSAHYQGPPAPLNKDGTVALTPEVQHARTAHDAAIAAEFKRFEAAKRLAAAYPDLTSPPDHGWKDYNSHMFNQGKGYNVYKHSATSKYQGQGPSYDKGQYSTSGHIHNLRMYMPAPLNKDGTVSLTPEVQRAKAAHDAAIVAERMRFEEAKRLAAAHPHLTSPPEHGWHAQKDYTPQLYNQGQYSKGHGHQPKILMPASLNKDGTVALTPEVQQAKAAHEAAINTELLKLMGAQNLAKAHPDLTSPAQHGWNVHQDYTSQLYNQGHYNEVHAQFPMVHMVAPLNKDGTVALTPEVQQAKAAHDAAVAAELKRLMEAQNLAEAHPDFTSPPTSLATSGQGPSHGKGHEYNPKTHMPAPLNKDGTVALTPEVQQAKAAHHAALDAEIMKLMKTESLAMAHPDMTSPQEHHEGQYMQGLHSEHGVPHPSVQSKNPEAQMPAPLNPDGTVAQTAAYKAIASSHNAEYEKILHNVNQHKTDLHFQDQAAEGYSY